QRHPVHAVRGVRGGRRDPDRSRAFLLGPRLSARAQASGRDMRLLLTYSFDWSVVLKSVPFFERGITVTLRITIFSIAFSLVLGLIVALVRMTPGPIGLIGFAYVQVFRALSLYVYILFIYFGIAAAFKLDFDPITAGVLSLTLLNSAYMAEIYRSAIQAIEPGQREAARSLG